MPYAPGVSYNPTPIALGLAGGVADIAQAMVAKKAQDDQDKDFLARSRATETFLKANGDALGFNGDQVKELLAPQVDETPRARAMRLGETLANGVTGATLKRQQAEWQRQQAEADLQAKVQNAHLATLARADQQSATNAAALKQAMAATAEGDDGVSMYANMGGNDVQEMNLLATRMKPGKPMAGSQGVAVEAIPGMGTLARDRATGEVIDSGKLYRPPATDPKEKSLTTEELQQITALQQAGRDLDMLEGAYNDIKDKDWGGPVAGRLKELRIPGTDKTLLQDTNAQRIAAYITGATPNLARGVFRERGVLTDQDVARYKQLLPDVTDTAAVRKQKFTDLRARLAESTKEQIATLKAAGREVGGLQDKILGGQSSGGDMFKDVDGTQYPIKTIRGQRGVIKPDGKFYPIVQ